MRFNHDPRHQARRHQPGRLYRSGGVAEWFRQGPAKPRTAVRFRPPPLLRAPGARGSRVADLADEVPYARRLLGRTRGIPVARVATFSAQLDLCLRARLTEDRWVGPRLRAGAAAELVQADHQQDRHERQSHRRCHQAGARRKSLFVTITVASWLHGSSLRVPPPVPALTLAERRRFSAIHRLREVAPEASCRLRPALDLSLGGFGGHVTLA